LEAKEEKNEGISMRVLEIRQGVTQQAKKKKVLTSAKGCAIDIGLISTQHCPFY
jgi:hypothetical protein